MIWTVDFFYLCIIFSGPLPNLINDDMYRYMSSSTTGCPGAQQTMWETWLSHEEYVSLNESTPPSHINTHIPRGTIDHDILLQRLDQSIVISGTALSWFKSYLSDWSQFVFVNDEASMTTNVNHGVPQGSVLGPILFTLYMLPLGNIIRKQCINFHCYADNTQLYLSIKPEETNQLAKLQECLKDIKTWMTCNFLMLNSDKTEVILLALNTSEINYLMMWFL